MMQKVVEEQKAYFHLDSDPKTLTAKPHRTAYGTDGIISPNLLWEMFLKRFMTL